jgi:hypothetical protein
MCLYVDVKACRIAKNECYYVKHSKALDWLTAINLCRTLVL